ncbi:2-acylglycerophosphoethanolamine acyltransferase / Acyl-[acyl-carrier-protein] synthetase [hydrothermal vent metagenome]|uniref:2-acylglycerophosphoethanolamine acyltransferase / Acyl-[acyl-carrier-protein] synthetase n=1 Tax=hydrothermal vent metagenome TaxID=652676 RepID=A0A3B0Z787_9ZZZZ
MIKSLLKKILAKLYRVDLQGLENFQGLDDRVLIVANHTSFLDAVLLALFLPGNLTFAVNSHMANHGLLKYVFKFVKIFPMDPTNPMSLKSMIRFLEKGNRVVIFPEGRITVTGALMKIFDGPGLIADKTKATVVVIRIEGAQYTPFSRLKGRVRLRWFPDITITVLPPQKITPPEELKGKARRKYAGRLLADIMTEMMFATSNIHRTLFQSLVDAEKIHGRNHVVVEDIERRPLNYQALITRCFVIGKAIAGVTQRKENVGVLLPSMVNTVAVFMGLQVFGRIPAMLNYTVGIDGMFKACETANIDNIITSRRFIQLAKLESVVESLSDKVKFIYLEDLAKSISTLDKLRGWLSAWFPGWTYNNYCPNAKSSDPAVVLFTSGSEGTPKGVVLSHTNLLANRGQLAARVDFTGQDIILNALPLFHSFGLAAGTLLPLLSGMRVFFYPSPLHYRIVPEIAYETNATILFGTNTFLSGYARFAHPYDFYSIRYVFAGAEKLQEETRRIWSEKFGVRIFEGYGATETSPGLSTNTPMDNQPGSVGRLMPGIEYQLEPVPGIDVGGRLYVKGPNVMLGYYLHDKPGVLVPPVSMHGDGWYDTGDIVTIDDDGFIRICGRAKRFAKIGGEMVSLAAVEELAATTWPQHEHAVIAVPDAQKGEQLILLTTYQEATRKGILTQAKKQGIGELNVPKKMVIAEKMPVLGTGKTDYQGVAQFIADTAKVDV